MVCSLKEFNESRQYLTTLKLEAEKSRRQEEVGKAQQTRVSGTVQKAGAFLVGSEGGRKCRRCEGCAGGPGVVVGKG